MGPSNNLLVWIPMWLLILGSPVNTTFAQNSGFDFGKITYAELDMNAYPPDTTAGAVVLKEFGEAYISNDDDNNLIFEYHVKIKILKRSGFEEANFSIPLYKDGTREEQWISLKATTFNLEGNGIKETKMEEKNFFLDKASRHHTLAKFTLPDIRVGSIIEVKYTLESPFFFNFRPWEFQGDIPKISSEYWAKIPGNYIYNIALKGFLKLTRNESVIVKDCYTPGGSYRAECVLGKFGMEHIPAFINEDYMTARSNFISCINFELSEIKRFDGTTNRITREWKDVDDELRKHENFGLQIRKARNLEDEKLKLMVGAETDPLRRATLIYYFVNRWYSWNGDDGKYSNTDIKKAYELRKGNVGDINLTLIGVLQAYDLEAYPVILSTRSNGLPVELYPVLSGFNYVIARVKIGEKEYLLDATDPFLPFGMLPIRCFNGRGRLISSSESGWMELKPLEKEKKVNTLDLKLLDNGSLHGKLTILSRGYAAVAARKEIVRMQDLKGYVKELELKWSNSEIINYANENLDDLTKPLIEKMEITIAGFDNPEAPTLYFSPFVSGRMEKNPFKSVERLYPVDLGVAEESTLMLTLELPTHLQVDESPANVAFQLPLGGGKFVLSTTNIGNKITMIHSLSLNKAIYGPDEYHHLKEYYARIIQAQQSQFVFKRK